VSQLPEVAEEFYDTDTTIVVGDSKIGWATAFRELVSLLYGGKVPRWDVTAVRPAGSPLKTFGGRASGPEPLVELFKFTVNLFKKAKGRKLTSVECHDLCCKIAEIVVVGGVRRSALLSLSNLTDQRMAKAKSGEWWKDNVQRALANNSICFTEKPDVGAFMREWNTIYESKSGERGIFNRVAAKKKVAENGRRDENHDWGCNPCSEIILRDREFCNLSEVVIRSRDGIDDIKRKVRLATILGTLQTTLTNFRYLGKKWKDNTEEEALLGVSLTGIMDHPALSGKYVEDSVWLDEEETKAMRESDLERWLTQLKEVAVDTNKEWAEKLGVNPSTAITTVKPSGTVSQLVDSASGIHPRYSPYYIRTVRADKKDPLARVMKEKGFPCEDDVTKPDSTWVFSFPVRAPEGSVFRDDRTALEQLELWLTYQRYWCEHKPSITVYVKEHEWPEVGAWVWNHFDEVSGVSFLPHTEHTYRQAPYQEITEQEYLNLVAKMPEFDFVFAEEYDTTSGSQELACVAGTCELVDLGEG
jgi:ribonucleoside-diphosphate reductase alpha chain